MKGISGIPDDQRQALEDIEQEIATALLPVLSVNALAVRGNVNVYLRGPTATVIIKNSLSPAEVDLGRTEEGRRLVAEWHRRIFDRLRAELTTCVERLLGSKVVGFHPHLDVNANQRVVTFTLDRAWEMPASCPKQGSNGKESS